MEIIKVKEGYYLTSRLIPRSGIGEEYIDILRIKSTALQSTSGNQMTIVLKDGKFNIGYRYTEVYVEYNSLQKFRKSKINEIFLYSVLDYSFERLWLEYL